MTTTSPDAAFNGIEEVEPLDLSGSPVHRGRRRSDGRPVAIKILDHLAEPLVPRRFELTRRGLSAFTASAGITPVLDAGTLHDGHQYLVMPYYPLGSLADQLGRGPTPWIDAAEIIQMAAHIVGIGHAQGVALGDLRPSNILLTDADRPVVSVWGMATRRFDDGRPRWAAPEVEHDRAVAPTADVYSLCLILASLVVGAAPDRLPLSPRFLARVAYLAPAGLYQVIEVGLADEPERRYADGARLARAVAAALHAGPGPDRHHPNRGTGDRSTRAGASDHRRVPAAGVDLSPPSWPDGDDVGGIDDPSGADSGGRVSLTFATGHPRPPDGHAGSGAGEPTAPLATTAHSAGGSDDDDTTPIGRVADPFAVSGSVSGDDHVSEDVSDDEELGVGVFGVGGSRADGGPETDPAAGGSQPHRPGGGASPSPDRAPFRSPDRPLPEAPSGRLVDWIDWLQTGTLNRPRSLGGAVAVLALVAMLATVVLLLARDLQTAGIGDTGDTTGTTRSELAAPATTLNPPRLVEPPSTHEGTTVPGRSPQTASLPEPPPPAGPATALTADPDPADGPMAGEPDGTGGDGGAGGGTDHQVDGSPTTARQTGRGEAGGARPDGDEVAATSGRSSTTAGSTTMAPTTRPEPDLIAGLEVSRIRPTSAQISFSSPSCVSATFTYAAGGGKARTVESDGSCNTAHALLLGRVTDPLAPGTSYRVTVVATDRDGDASSRTVSFTTLG